MISTKRQLTLGLLAGLAGFGVTTSAHAQTTPQSTVILNTALTLAYQAPNGEMPTKRRDGAGAMDTTIDFDRTTGDIFSFFTMSVPWGNETGAVPGINTGMQAALAYTKLTTTGLTTPTIKKLPLQGYNGEQRVFMRPNTMLGKDFVAVVFADENNGVDDGNPQSVVWVYDRNTMNQLNVTNASSIGQNPTDPINLITLSGDNDGQQQCPHSYCKLPPEADGSESWIMGQQYNNQQARVMKVNFKTDGAGGVKVTVPYIKTIVQNARHNRVQLACNPTTGQVATHYIVATSVEADEQPANYGIRAVLVDTDDGHVAASTRFVQADQNNQIWMVQPTAQYISETQVAIQYQSAAAPENRNNGGANHSGDPNLSYLATLNIPAPDVNADFTVIQTTPRVAPYNRHAEAFGLQYGEDGKTMPAVGIIGGSSTGLAEGLVQIMPLNSDGTFNAQPDPLKIYQVSKYSDIAGLPAMTKRDPDQARGFIHTYSGLPNPGYKLASGFMPEVKTFSVSAVAGYNNPNTDNRESLTFALIPASWDPAYNTTPGGATSNVPPGPSPTAPGGTPVTNPTGPSSGAPTPGQASGGSTGSSGGTGGVRTGFGGTAGASNGCGCTTAGADKTSGLTGFAALGLGIAFLGLRRRSAKKES